MKTVPYRDCWFDEIGTAGRGSMRLLQMTLVAVVLSSLGTASSLEAQERSSCFRLSFGEWRGTRSLLAAHQVPDIIQLDTAADTVWSRPGQMVLRTTLTKGARRFSSWRRLSEDSIQVGWSSGFVGIHIAARLTGDSIAGVALAWRDDQVGGGLDPKAIVTGVRTACPKSGLTQGG
jgi:hypothetical protein